MKITPATPKMNDTQARTFWNALTPQQKFQFNEMLQKMEDEKLMLTHVNVDDNETIQNIVLEPKDKPGKPTAPFAKHFKQENKQGNYMSRIDVQTLVLAFESRISELNKNPIEVVPTKTVQLLLEAALENEIKENFRQVIKIEIKNSLNKEFNKLKGTFIKNILKDVMSDSLFKQEIQDKIKSLILKGL